jgi:anti-anti-sigma factor
VLDGPDSITLHLSGECDLAGGDELRAALDAATDSARTITIDLSELAFIDCSALACLTKVAARLADDGGKLILAGGSGQVSRLLELTGIPRGAERRADAAVLRLVAPDDADAGRRPPDTDQMPGADRPTRRTESPLAAVSREIVRLYSGLLGRGPTKARTHLHDDYGLCVLEDGLTRGERSLVAAGRSEQVIEMRNSLHELIAPELASIVEAQTGRPVRRCLGQIDPAADLALLYFHFGRGDTADD